MLAVVGAVTVVSGLFVAADIAVFESGLLIAVGEVVLVMLLGEVAVLQAVSAMMLIVITILKIVFRFICFLH